jgi:hypothetical protein
MENSIAMWGEHADILILCYILLLLYYYNHVTEQVILLDNDITKIGADWLI